MLCRAIKYISLPFILFSKCKRKNIKMKERKLDNFIVVQNYTEARSTSKSIQKKTNTL